MMFVRPDVQAFLAFLNAQPGPKMHELEPSVARDMMRAMVAMADRPRGPLARVDDIAIDGPAGNRIPLRIYSDGDGDGTVLVYYHGGGWVIGDLETHDSLCAEIARTLGVTVVSVDYRLAPEHAFPAAVDDCLAATRWVAGSPPEIGHSVSGLVLAGDSAGGNLAAVSAQALNDKLAVPILAQWLIYPGVDMAAAGGSMDAFADDYLLTRDSMLWFMNHYLGANPPQEDVRASPIRGALAGQPAALVFTCGLDPLRDQGRAYAGKLIAAGVPTVFREAAGQIHGCFNSRQAITSAQDDLIACLGALKAILAEARGNVRPLAAAAE
jgi:acetyl esterase